MLSGNISDRPLPRQRNIRSILEERIRLRLQGPPAHEKTGQQAPPFAPVADPPHQEKTQRKSAIWGLKVEQASSIPALAK